MYTLIKYALGTLTHTHTFTHKLYIINICIMYIKIMNVKKWYDNGRREGKH